MFKRIRRFLAARREKKTRLAWCKTVYTPETKALLRRNLGRKRPIKMDISTP